MKPAHATPEIRRNRSCKPAIQVENHNILVGVQNFVMSHPFPGEAYIREYIQLFHQEHQVFLHYGLAKRLLEAIVSRNEEEMYTEIRRVGYLMNSFDAMNFNLTLVDDVMCNEEGMIAKERDRNVLSCPAVNYYKDIVCKTWDGCNGWRH